MNTQQRQASRAKRQAPPQPQQLPKFWRKSLDGDQKMLCKVTHWDNLANFTNGKATVDDLLDWMETGATYAGMMRLLILDGVEFTDEAISAINDQIDIYLPVAQRYARTRRVGFTGPELMAARAAAYIFNDLVEIDRHGIALQAATESAALMERIKDIVYGRDAA